MDLNDDAPDELVGHEGDGLSGHDAHESWRDALPERGHALLLHDEAHGLHDACVAGAACQRARGEKGLRVGERSQRGLWSVSSPGPSPF